LVSPDINDIFALYLKCFPDYPVSKEAFCNLLQLETAEILSDFNANKLIGFSIVRENTISLLCVDPFYRAKGVGSRLLQKSETAIAGQNFKHIILGRGKHYLLQGVPAEPTEISRFFQKRGYSAEWTSADMNLCLNHFSALALDIPPAPETVVFRFATEKDSVLLLNAVQKAEPAWKDFFISPSEPILIAFHAGEIAGFEFLSPKGGRFVKPESRTGSIGCVGVVPEERKKGIGRQLVSKGAEWLKLQGCMNIELRYVALVDWYQKIGFEVIRRQWMGEKDLSAV